MTAIFVRIGDLFSGVWALIRKWPVRAQALVVAGISLGTAFGLSWDGTQVGAVAAFSAALLAFLTEQAVTPLENPTIPEGTRVTVTTPEGEPDRVVTT